MTVLSLREVGKWFGSIVALESIDLDVEAGEIVVLLGKSGCGKSTLLRLVSGLDSPTNGRVEIAGRTVSGPGPDVGVIFQEPRLMPWLTVADNVGFGLPAERRDAARELVDEAVERVGLAPFADALPRQLSGGMAQRVAIARALVVKPPLLLLDEPFSALDAFTRHDLQDHLLDLWSWYQPTMLVVTHDLDEAIVLADRIVIMSNQPGRIAAEIDVDLDRPRRLTDPGFSRLRERVHESLADVTIPRVDPAV